MTPGDHLHLFLRPHRISQTQLARAIGVSRVKVTLIMNGYRPISADTAVRLERALGTPAEHWLALQAKWDAQNARIGAAADLERVQVLLPPGVPA
jgi:addiction module HigA family antidote